MHIPDMNITQHVLTNFSVGVILLFTLFINACITENLFISPGDVFYELWWSRGTLAMRACLKEDSPAWEAAVVLQEMVSWGREFKKHTTYIQCHS